MKGGTLLKSRNCVLDVSVTATEEKHASGVGSVGLKGVALITIVCFTKTQRKKRKPKQQMDQMQSEPMPPLKGSQVREPIQLLLEKELYPRQSL